MLQGNSTETKNKVDTSEAEEKVPSYVGLSCAVSGYRSLNKYNAAIREDLQVQTSPTRIAQASDQEGKILHISSDVSHKENLNLPYIPVPGCTMFPSTPSNGYSSRMMKTQDGTHSTLAAPGTPVVNGTSSEASGNSSSSESPSGKSFIQQRIERLYGPGALGMAFCAKRAQLERSFVTTPTKIPINDETSYSFEGKESPPGMPSVFKHLTPEFRTQLPVKPKRLSNGSIPTSSNGSSSTSPRTNGHGAYHPNSTPRVRNIPIQLEEEKISPLSNSRNIPIRLEENADDVPDRKATSSRTNDIVLSVKPKTNTDSVNSSFKNSLDLDRNIEPTNVSSSSQDSQVKDGNYFLKVVDGVVSGLEPLVARVDRDLETDGDVMSEEVRGKLLAAVGKTKLLIAQKVDQFKGLCHKNLKKCSSEEFPTTNEDLAGFWDMVNLQVDHIYVFLKEVDALRDNQWKELTPVKMPAATKQPAKKALTSRTKIVSAESKEQAAAKQRANEARRKAMRDAINAKRKAAKASSADDVEIFVSVQ